MSDDLVTLGERLRQSADVMEREAKSLDVENPEPDEWCPAAGGDGARSVAQLLREAADALGLLEHERDRLAEEKIALIQEAQRVTEKYIDEADERVKAADASRDALAERVKALEAQIAASPNNRLIEEGRKIIEKAEAT